MKRKRIGVLAGAALAGLTVMLVMAIEVASQPAGPPSSPSALRECKPSERRTVLREEQAAVLRKLGRFTVLRSPADVVELAKPPQNYAFLAHQYTSFRGIGLTVINPFDTPRPGVPNLIFYAPAEGAANVTDPRGPDFPYTLVGWAYGVPYEPGRIPAIIPCMGVRDWHIHERGVHPIDTGGMVPMPPTETRYGETAGSFAEPPALDPVIGFPHPRSWTVHFWLASSGTPRSAILDPTDPPPGIDPGLGSSFYFPEQPVDGALQAAQSSRARPFVFQAGQGPRVNIRGSTYTFKAEDGNASGAFAVIEIVLRSGSEPPTHIHHREAESFYVLEGEMTFIVAGQVFAARKGSFIYLPRGIAHGYFVNGNGVARVLLIASPPGLERFFRRLGELGDTLPTILESLSFGIEPVGPPPSALFPQG